MKKAFAAWIVLVFGAIFILTSFAWGGDVYVRPYVRSDGTYVQGHYRSAPDGNPWNNYSTRGNVNPYTGQKGYRSPYSSSGGGSSFSPYSSNSNSLGNFNTGQESSGSLLLD